MVTIQSRVQHRQLWDGGAVLGSFPWLQPVPRHSNQEQGTGWRHCLYARTQVRRHGDTIIVIVFFCFFILNFLRAWVLFVGPLIPLFWISGDISSGFQSLIHIWRRRTCYMTIIVIGGSKGGTRDGRPQHTHLGSISFIFMQLLGQSWHTPLPRENPGSATDCAQYLRKIALWLQDQNCFFL